MDTQKTGAFLAQLRREHGLTQEQLGARLGVTNKTISRWENGNYMPPVDLLQSLSQLYQVSINEILSAQRLTDHDYKRKAEENIRSALENSAFTRKEKLAYFKRKWQREHLWSTILLCAAMVILYVLGVNGSDARPNLLLPFLVVAFSVVRYNQMMIYVEEKVFGPLGGSHPDAAAGKPSLRLNRAQMAALILLALSCVMTIALGTEFFYSLVPESGDGLTIHSSLAYLVYGDHWSRERFLHGFLTSLNISGLLIVFNTVIALLRLRTKASS